MNLIKASAAVALLSLSAGSFAAKPTSIVFQGNGESTEGKPFATYQVKCSNGKQVPVTAWDKRRKWCVGEASTDSCERKQIKAAKAACQTS
jgi:hypothetical protein